MAESLQPGSGTWGPAQPAMLSTLPSPILILKGLGALPADKMCVCVCVFESFSRVRLFAASWTVTC